MLKDSILTLILLVANLGNAKWCKNLKNDWNPGILVLIWEHSTRAIQWVPTWPGLDGFQKSLRPSALEKSSLSIRRVILNMSGSFKNDLGIVHELANGEIGFIGHYSIHVHFDSMYSPKNASYGYITRIVQAFWVAKGWRGLTWNTSCGTSFVSGILQNISILGVIQSWVGFQKV